MPRVITRPPPAASRPSSGDMKAPISAPAASAAPAAAPSGTESGARTSTSLSTSTGPSFTSFFQRVSVFSPGRDQIAFHCGASSAALPLFEGLALHFGFSAGLGPPDSSSRGFTPADRSEEHTSELQSHVNLVCRLLLE